MIHEVKPEDVQHFENKQFVRITDEQMPEILKFIDESDRYQFEDWAIIGETKGEEDEESIPGSSEPPIDASSQQKVLLSTKTPGDVDAGAATPSHLAEEEGEEEE